MSDIIETIFPPNNSATLGRWIERLPLARGHLVFGWIGTLAIVSSAWQLRTVAGPFLPTGFPYVTFFPAVIVTSFLFGVRFGAASALMCGLISWYFFLGPPHSFDVSYRSQVALAFYIFVVATDLALVHWMQTANRDLIIEREVNRTLVNSKEQMVRELHKRVKERKEAADALLESEVQTGLATRTAGIGLWQWNVKTDRIHLDRTMFDLYGLTPSADGSIGFSDYMESVYPEDAATQHASLQDTVAKCGESEREFRIHRRDDGRVSYIRAFEIARAGADGKTEWVVGTNLDITYQRNREAHINLLMSEINHRAKNMLGVVMAVAQQTGGIDHPEFMRRFSARIRSLAAGQDLLVKSQWRGVLLDTLARAQLDHFSGLVGERISLAGPPALLMPSAVQTIGMAIHELCTNASKYGALSNERGRVEIVWDRVQEDVCDRFIMTWTEFDGPVVVAPSRRGFGSTVTGKMVQMSLDGEVTADFAPSGCSWRLNCPWENIIDSTTLIASENAAFS